MHENDCNRLLMVSHEVAELLAQIAVHVVDDGTRHAMQAAVERLRAVVRDIE